MRVVTNEQLIKKNRGRATRLFFFSLAVLIAGFLIANGQLLGVIPPDALNGAIYVFAMPVVLIIGFMATMASVRMTNLWMRVPRPEKAIPEGLKGISNKSVLYNYLHFPARHVLITPQGVFAIVTRFQDGKFSVNGKRWRAKKGPIGTLLTFMRLDGIGNPTLEASLAEQHVREIVESWDEGVKVQGLIVFVDSKAEVTIENPEFPVLFADSKKKPSLREYVKAFNGGKTLGPFEGNGIKEFIEEWEEATLE